MQEGKKDVNEKHGHDRGTLLSVMRKSRRAANQIAETQRQERKKRKRSELSNEELLERSAVRRQKFSEEIMGQKGFCFFRNHLIAS